VLLSLHTSENAHTFRVVQKLVGNIFRNCASFFTNVVIANSWRRNTAIYLFTLEEGKIESGYFYFDN